MNTKTTALIDAFWSDEPQGICSDDEFEYGTLHSKTIKCLFCVDGQCHYKQKCERRYTIDTNDK